MTTTITSPAAPQVTWQQRNIRTAIRAAGTIDTFKLILMLLSGLGVLGCMIGAFSQPESGGAVSGIFFMAALGCLFNVLLTYVLFGWFEHVLRMLAVIAVQFDR